MDHLRQGIHLRGYAQKDPKQEYKREAFTLFSMMLDNLKYDIIRMLGSVEIKTEEDVGAIEELRRAEQAQKMQFIHADDTQAIADENITTTFKRNEQKVGRNDTCPCGSGKKYKNCHGSLA
jgi:preprotein translocase subunit SecA